MRRLSFNAFLAGLMVGLLVFIGPPAGAADNHLGGTLKLAAAGAFGTLDPHINYTTSQYWPISYIVNDGLVTFKKAEGSAGNEIVPDLAVAMPKVEDGGKTYVFTLRKGVKFSTGNEVTTKDVVASFRRLFKVQNPNIGSWYNSIVGADACLKTPATCTLEGGVVADEAANTIAIHLTAPDSEFLYKIAIPFGAILPADTPATDIGTTPPVATGPYMITGYDPQKVMTLKRNPHFKEFSAEAQPNGNVDEIVYAFGTKPEDAVTAIANGQLDWMYDTPPSDRLKEISSRYPKQIHINPLFAYYVATMNVNIPPFNNKDARLALNYAFNRRSAVNILGGPNLAQPNCQVLPVGFPGFKAYCPYTKNPGAKWSAPDMAKAKALMAKSGQIGQKVTVIASDSSADPNLGTYLVSVLNELGFQATLKVISANIQFTYIQNTNNNVQISISELFPDYPAPSNFIITLLNCGQFHKGSDASINIAGYCNQDLDAKMQEAMILALTDTAASHDMWSQIDHQATDDAPWVTMLSPKRLDFVSTNLKNFPYSDLVGLLFSKVYVR